MTSFPSQKPALSTGRQSVSLSRSPLCQGQSRSWKGIGLALFNRSGKGATLTAEGVTPLPYARSVIMQYQSILDAYGASGVRKQRFAASTRHYFLAVKAF